MKTLKLAFVALFGLAVLVSCDKEDTDSLITTKDCKITKIVEKYGTDNSRVMDYIYNSEGMVVKINHSDIDDTVVYAYDTLIYNSSGQITEAKTMSVHDNSLYERIVFTWVGGKITTIVSYGYDNTEPTVETTTITYVGDKVLTLSTSGGREAMAFKEIVYSNGNISTLKADFSGEGNWVNMKVLEVDDKVNIAKYMIPDWEGILFGSNANNFKVLAFDQDVPSMDIVSGRKALNRSYTYNSDNLVTSVTSDTTVFQNEKSVMDITWMCK